MGTAFYGERTVRTARPRCCRVSVRNKTCVGAPPALKCRPMRRTVPSVRVRLALVALVVWLAGCAGGPYGVVGVPTLAEEERRLRSQLAGTPVAIDVDREGRLHLEVPLRHSFDPGRSAVKPPLAAVLERMAAGLKPQTTLLRVAAPADPRGSELLALDRAASVRDYLVARGVAFVRFAPPQRGERDAVEIVVSERAR